MFGFKELQLKTNKFIAKKNKEYIINRLEKYFKTVYYDKDINFKEYSIRAFWEAKKQGRLDTLNRIIKN